MVAAISPPITARPSGAFCSPPAPIASDIGSMPRIIASAVMITGRMRVAPALDRNFGARREVLHRVDLFLHRPGHAAKIGALDPAVHVDHPLNCVMVDPLRLNFVGKRRNVSEVLRRRHRAVELRRGQGSSPNSLYRIDYMLGRLHRDAVANAIPHVEPLIWRCY